MQTIIFSVVLYENEIWTMKKKDGKNTDRNYLATKSNTTWWHKIFMGQCGKHHPILTGNLALKRKRKHISISMLLMLFIVALKKPKQKKIKRQVVTFPNYRPGNLHSVNNHPITLLITRVKFVIFFRSLQNMYKFLDWFLIQTFPLRIHFYLRCWQASFGSFSNLWIAFN